MNAETTKDMSQRLSQWKRQASGQRSSQYKVRPTDNQGGVDRVEGSQRPNRDDQSETKF